MSTAKTPETPATRPAIRPVFPLRRLLSAAAASGRAQYDLHSEPWAMGQWQWEIITIIWHQLICVLRNYKELN